MRSVVLKIGGGILRDKNCFDRVVDVIRGKNSEFDSSIIVLSALYGITDFLISCADEALTGRKPVEELISELRARHVHYLSMVSGEQARVKAEKTLSEKIAVLEQFLFGVRYLKELSPRSRDLIQSFGERLSPIVLEAFLSDAGVGAQFLDAEDAGLLCKGPFENAVVDFEATKANLLKRTKGILGKKVLLLPGYYAVDASGDVRTFGRGGTDYSAGFIASIFGAKLEIWKDVSGFMTADPKIVPTARQIAMLSYSEAEELGYLGAKILHPKTIAPLRERNLSAEVKNLFDPSRVGTLISAERDFSDGVVKSVTTMKNIALVTVSSTTMFNGFGFASMIFSVLTKAGVSVDLIATSQTAISVSLDVSDLEPAIQALNAANTEALFEVTWKKDLAMLGVVGEGMRDTCGIAGRLFSVLGEQKINVEMISQGGSEINISLIVRAVQLNQALLAVHAEFIR